MSAVPSTASRVAHPLRMLAVLALAGIASQVQALGLGEARVISGLNAPLVAEIEILDATPEELAALRAEIPGRDIFTRYGLDWPAFLTTASVTVRNSAAGKPVLVLRTEQAVSEPFLTVLVAANWGRGRVLREFNLVVDRPSATAEPLTPIEVQAPGVGSERSGTVERAPQGAEPVAPPPPAATTPEPATPDRTERADERPNVVSRPAARSGDAVTVRRGDSLYNIAERLSRRSAATTSQLMVGLYRANPEAFGASMNDLRSGAVLRVPDLAELSALPPSTVAAEVNRAVSVWRNRSGAAARAADPGGRLRLVAPTEVAVGTGGEGRTRLASIDGTDIPAGTGASKSATSDETPEQRLARVEKELLEKERLLELTNAQLAELQAKSDAAPATAQRGIVDTLRALFGKAWWSWALLLLAVFALVGVLMSVRRRAAAAEAELQAWSSAPRSDVRETAAESAVVDAVDPLVAPVEPQPEDEDEGDPPTIEEAGSKIDLARAFIEMGEQAAARAELEDVLRIGNVSQRQEAQRLLDSLR